MRARIARWLAAWIEKAGIAEDDPAPEYSFLDRLDGLR